MVYSPGQALLAPGFNAEMTFCESRFCCTAQHYGEYNVGFQDFVDMMIKNLLIQYVIKQNPLAG